MATSTLKPPTPRKKLVKFFVWLVFIVGFTLLLVINQRNILDYLTLFDYHPSNTVSTLSTADTMTPYAKRVFYVNNPQVDSKSAFKSVCPNGTEQTVVLGCYHSNQQGIYLLSVSDPRLSGIEQVTAAHETLHAIYDRLSSSKRSQLDSWLLSFYNSGLTDPTIKAQIASYRKTEPNAVVNEMDSLFGTEVGSLPAHLESYYAQYFKDRQVVVGYYNDYQAAFNSREAQITSDDSQLTSLGNQITTTESDLSQKLTNIKAYQQTLLGYQNSGNIDTYNQDVPTYNQMVDVYNSELDGLKSNIDQYNQLVDARNQLALEEQQLVQDISSAPSPL